MRKLTLLIIALFAYGLSFGQTVLINPAGDGGFETGADFTANGWTVVNNATNQWFVGTAAFSTGVNGAYISNNAGVANAYTNTIVQTSHFYRDITVPAGETKILFSYKWKGNGESGWDRLLVYTAPTTVTPVAGTPAANSTILTGATLIFTQGTFPQAAYFTQIINIPPSLAGTTFRLIFTWQNDVSGGTTPPAAIDEISLTSQTPSPLHGTYTIDNTLPTSTPILHDGTDNFASFTAAINYLNADGISGPVTFNVLPDQTFTEETPVIIASGTIVNNITFQKSGAGLNPVISSTGAAGSEAGIYLKGGDYFTFDGIDIKVTSGSLLEYGYYVLNASATDGAQFNTIKNCKVTLGRTNTASRGVFQYWGTTAATNATGTNSNNTYQNIIVENAYQGVYLNGTSAAYPDDNCVVTGCSIGAPTANDIGGGSVTCYGLRASYCSNVTFLNNTVRNVYTSAAVVGGIFVEQFKGTLNNISNNKVYSVRTASTTSTNYVYGIRSDGNIAADIMTIQNNTINDLSHGIITASTTVSIRAMAINIGSTGTHNIYYNTVYISGGSIASSAALHITGAATHTIKNNIFYNASSGGATSKRYCINRQGGTLVSNNNNLLNVAGTNNFIGFYTADQATLASWQTASGSQDLNSVSIDPLFVSATDLHFRNYAMNNLGTPIAGITTDFDGDTRNVTTPDIGADEYEDIVLPFSTFIPATGATGVPVSTTIEVTYSENIRNLDNSVIDNTNVAGLITFTDAVPTSIPFTATWDAINNKINIIPSFALASSTQYTVSAVGIEDSWNNTDGGSSTNFTTGLADLSSPVIDSAIVYNINPLEVKIFFNENIKLTDASGITINVNSIPATINSFTGTNSKTLTFTLAASINSHEIVTFSYNSALGDLTDIVGNELATITDLTVINRVISSAKDITAFSFTTPVVTGIINGINISIYVPNGTDVTALVPTFTISAYANVTPLSGVAQNFTSPITYTVTAEDLSTKIYTVTVYQTYTFPYSQNFENAGAIPTGWLKTSAGASNWDFVTADALYGAATAQSGSGYFARLDVYNILSSNNPLNLFTPAFSIPTTGVQLLQYYSWIGSAGSANPLYLEVSTDNKNTWIIIKTHDNITTPNTWYKNTINVSAYNGMNAFFRFRGISNYGSGTCNLEVDDFTVYTASTAKDITAFNFTTPASTGTIAGTNITLNVPAGTDLTNLIPTITTSALSTVSPLTGVANNFTTPATYTVTAEDGSMQVYTVTVLVDAPTVTFIPANGTTGVPNNTTVKITFNAPVRMLDNSVIDDINVDALITFKTPNGTGTDVAFDAVINPAKTEITLTPTSNLTFGAIYYVAIGATVEGNNDNPIFATNASFTITEVVGWCNLQWPATLNVNSSDNSNNVFAQVWADGITNFVGQGANITAWIGFSTTNTDPSTWTDWKPAVYNNDAGNNDEYMANVGYNLSEGTYYYASRFRLGNGVYSYGGLGGFWNGTTSVSGVATITDNTAPVVTSASVENAAPANLVVNFSENVTVTDATGFIVYISGNPVVINSVTGSGTNVLTFTLATTILSHEFVTLSYDGSGNVKDMSVAQNLLASFGVLAHPVTNNVLSSSKDILTFGIQTPFASGTINGTNITVYLPAGTALTNLIAEFTLSNYATAYIGATLQNSGGTVNNFTSPVTYTINAEDGTTKNYIVTVLIYYPIPYTQNFNAATTLPAGWGGTMTVSATHGNASNGLNRNLYSSVATANTTAPIVGTATNLTVLTFDYRIVNWSGYPATATVIGVNDKIDVQVSTDNGITYATIYTINNLNHITSTAFAIQRINLNAFAGQNIKVKLLCTWGAGDYYVDIDNFNIFNVVVPTLTTTVASAITGSTASSGGNITIDGGALVTARGVCWNTTGTPILTDNHTTDGTGIGTFVSDITGLSLNTPYFVRAYATNAAGTSYGNEITFTTAIADAPTVTTTPITSVTGTTASTGGDITADGGSVVLESGIVYSTTANPTVLTGTKVLTSPLVSAGTYVSNLTGLTLNTTYHVRAYAVNSIGAGYGTDFVFTTNNIPTLTTAAVTGVTLNTATSGGDITNNGNDPILTRGICWGTSLNPDTNSNHSHDGNGSGIFVSNMLGLAHSTMYHVRAYAVNANGIAFGNDVVFQTACGVITNFPWTEGFEGTIFPPTCWTIDNPNAASITWTQANVSNGTPTKAAFMDFYGYSSTGHLDNLVTPVFDFTNHTPVLAFRVAYTPYSVIDSDTLRIYISTDGGTSYNSTPVYSKGGSDLATIPFVSTAPAFAPSVATDWRTETIDLSSFIGNNVKFKFQAKNGYGNNLYIDDIKVFDPPTAIVSGTATICNGESTDVTITLTGTPPWTFTGNDGSGDATFIINTSPYVSVVNPIATTTFSPVSISDANGVGSVSGSATITVNNAPVLTIVNPATVCPTSTVNITTAVTSNTNSGSLTYWMDAAATNALTNPTSVSIAGTYYIKSTNTCGFDIKPVNVIFHSLPLVTANSTSTSVCSGTQITLTGGGANTYSWSNGVANGVAFEPTTSMTYFVTGTDNNGCNNTSQIAITVNSLPTAVISGTNSICNGQTTNISVALTGTGPWVFVGNDGTGDATFNATSSPLILPVSPNTTTTYSPVSIIDANCTGTVSGSAVVTVNSLPTATLSGTTTVCAGTPADLSFVLTGAGPWTIVYNNGLTDVTLSNITSATHIVSLTPVSTTTYTLVSVADANCTGTTSGSAIISVNTYPVATVESFIEPSCGASTGSISVTSNALYTYLWSDASAQTTATASNLTSGLYTVTVTYNGCSLNLSRTLGNIGAPTVTLTSSAGSNTICAGENVTFTVTGFTSGTYEFFVDNIHAVTVTYPTNTFSTSALTNGQMITVKADDGSCVSFSNAITTTVHDLPTAVLTGTTSVCVGASTQLSVALTGTQPWTLIYNDGISFIDITVSNITASPYIIDVTAASPATYTLVSITDANCTGITSGNAVITVNPLPTASVSGDATICEGSSTNITLTFTGTGPWVFVGDDGSGPQTMNAATSPLIDTVSPVTTTTYTLISVSDAYCTGTTSGSTTITVNTLPTATVTGTTTICNGGSTDVSVALTGTGPWVFVGNDGSGDATFNATSSPLILSVTPNTNTTYIPVSITDANCIGTVSGNAVITVNDLPTAVLSGDATICNGTSTNLSVALTGNTPWSVVYNDGTNDVTANNILTSPFVVSVNPTVSTNYTLVSISGANCIGSVSGSANIFVNDVPGLTIVDPIAVCSPATVDITSSSVITGNTNGGVLSYWQDIAATVPVATPTAVTANGMYYINSTNLCGTTVETVNVTISNAAPTLTIVDPSATCEPNTIDITSGSVVTGNTNNGILSYWEDAIATIVIANPTAISLTGTYFIKTQNGCGEDTKAVNVTVNPLPVLVVADPTPVCSPGTANITSPSVIISNLNGGVLSYWKDLAATITVGDPTQVGASGTYYIKSENLCGSVIESVNVSIITTPILTVVDPSSVCSSNTVDITSTSVITGNTDNGTLTYWEDAGATIAVADPTAVAIAGVYYIQSENSCGIDLASVTVSFNYAPVLTIVDPTAVCSSLTIDITSPSVITGNTNSGILTYWEDATATTAVVNPNAISIAGIYYIQSTNSCGSDIQPVNVTFNFAPVLTIINPSAACESGTVDITTTSVITSNTNNGVLSFWEDITATISITDPTVIDINGTFYIQSTNACGSVIEPVDVTFNPLPTGSVAISGASTICSGDTTQLVLSFTGTAPWSFIGDDGSGQQTFNVPVASATMSVSPNGTTTYTMISVTDGNGCTAQVNQGATVNVFATPVGNLATSDTLCFNTSETVTLNAGNAGATYLWTGGSTSQTLLVESAVIGLGTYVYTVTVTNGNCSNVDSISILVDICSGVPVNEAGALISIYPNPTKGGLSISANCLSKESVISIVNVTGQVIFEEKTDAANFTSNLDLSIYPKGVYFVKIINNKITKIERIILQ